MAILHAHQCHDFGTYRRKHDGTEYVISAISYVQQRDDDDWHYIFLVTDPVGGKQAFDCFVRHEAGMEREDADRLACTEIVVHIHSLLETAIDPCVPTSAKGTNYYVILPTRHRAV